MTKTIAELKKEGFVQCRVFLDDETNVRIEKFRTAQKNKTGYKPSKDEAMRMLIKIGLTTEKIEY